MMEWAESDRRFMFGARHHIGFKTPIDSPYSPPPTPKSTTPTSTNKRKKTNNSDKENTVNNSVKKVSDVLMKAILLMIL